MIRHLRINDTHHRVILLTTFQAGCAVFGFLSESLANRFVLNLTFVAQLALLVVTLNFHHRALRLLLNTFWSITVALLVFYTLSFTRNALVLENTKAAVFYGLAWMLLMLSAWQISSPLYYPLVQWWEYDFRFRSDIRVTAKEGDTDHQARLTDLRRGAGCVMMFQQIPVGTVLEIRTDVLHLHFGLKAEVVSRKEQILGRAYHYGVRFRTEDLEQRQRLKLLTYYWREGKDTKKRSKNNVLT